MVAICEKFNNQISFYKADTGEKIQKFEVLPKGSTVTDIQFSSNSRYVAFSGDDATYGLLNTVEERVEKIFTDHNPNYSCVSVSLSQSDGMLACGSADGTLICR